MSRLATLMATPMVPETMSTGIPFLDRLLDGGVRPGASYLTVGAPGSGKTILWWQVAKAIDTLYIDTQDGLGMLTSDGAGNRSGSMLASLGDASRIIDTIAYRPQHIRLVVVDSIDSVTMLPLVADKIRPSNALVRKLVEAAREPGSCAEHEDCRTHASLARACAGAHPKPSPAIVFTQNSGRGGNRIPRGDGVHHLADVVMSIDGPEVNRGVQRRSVYVLKNRFGGPWETRDLPLQHPTAARPYMHWPTT